MVGDIGAAPQRLAFRKKIIIIKREEMREGIQEVFCLPTHPSLRTRKVKPEEGRATCRASGSDRKKHRKPQGKERDEEI